MSQTVEEAKKSGRAVYSYTPAGSSVGYKIVTFEGRNGEHSIATYCSTRSEKQTKKMIEDSRKSPRTSGDATDHPQSAPNILQNGEKSSPGTGKIEENTGNGAGNTENTKNTGNTAGGTGKKNRTVINLYSDRKPEIGGNNTGLKSDAITVIDNIPSSGENSSPGTGKIEENTGNGCSIIRNLKISI